MGSGEAGSAAPWVRAASGLEVLTGLGLAASPSALSRLLFGSDLNGAGEAMGRIAGLVMACLAAGCWPRGSDAGSPHALAPLLALSVLAALYLVVVGLAGATVGALLWPTAALHLLLAILLALAGAAARRATE